jgi:hypothetical protein
MLVWICVILSLLFVLHKFRSKLFFCIPNRLAEANARERINTTVVKVVKGVLTAK